MANRYYNLAHAVNERVLRQPSMLRAGTLRDYQLVGSKLIYFCSLEPIHFLFKRICFSLSSFPGWAAMDAFLV